MLKKSIDQIMILSFDPLEGIQTIFEVNEGELGNQEAMQLLPTKSSPNSSNSTDFDHFKDNEKTFI